MNPMNDKEYEMMRAEILQYLEEYQTVRNMMYVVTGAVLALNLSAGNVRYLYLVPLFIIIPSFLLHYNYNRCVTVASIYLQVFCEDKACCGYRWEGRHARFSLNERTESRRDQFRKWINDHANQFPYVVTAALCLIAYTAFTITYWNNTGLVLSRLIFDIILGVVCLGLCIYIFAEFWSIDEKKIKLTWEKVKEKEELYDSFCDSVQSQRNN